MDTILEKSNSPQIQVGVTSSSKRNPFEGDHMFEPGQLLYDSTEFAYDNSTSKNLETPGSRPTTYLTNNTKMSHKFKGDEERKKFKAIDQRQIDLRTHQVQPPDSYRLQQSKDNSRQSGKGMKTPSRNSKYR